MVLGLIAKVRNSMRGRGVLGTLGLGVRKVWERVLEQMPARRRARRDKEREDQDFDRSYGVDTGGVIPLDRVDVLGGNRAAGVSYWAIGPDDFRRALGAVAVRHEDFVFIDYGSGKGRALLLASEWPFKKIVGVEFSPTLQQTAAQNLRTFRSDRQRCRAIELVGQDAAAFPVPPEPLVCYFFNPFQREIMEKVIDNLRRSWEEHPREIVVVYCNPQLEELWQQAGFLHKAGSAGNCSIYRTAPAGGSVALPKEAAG